MVVCDSKCAPDELSLNKMRKHVVKLIKVWECTCGQLKFNPGSFRVRRESLCLSECHSKAIGSHIHLHSVVTCSEAIQGGK
jgi:hypothetical protein